MKRPASRPTSQRLDPSTVSRRHTTMSETSRVRRHPTMSETSNPIQIWPSGSRPVFGSLLSRGRLASFRVWWCSRRSCRSFGGFPRGLFLVLALSCFSAFVVRGQFSLSEVNRAGSMDETSLVHPGQKWFSPVSWVVRSGRLSLAVSGREVSEGPDAFPGNVMDFHVDAETS